MTTTKIAARDITPGATITRIRTGNSWSIITTPEARTAARTESLAAYLALTSYDGRDALTAVAHAKDHDCEERV